VGVYPHDRELLVLPCCRSVSRVSLDHMALHLTKSHHGTPEASGRKGEKFRALKAQEASRTSASKGGNGTVCSMQLHRVLCSVCACAGGNIIFTIDQCWVLQSQSNGSDGPAVEVEWLSACHDQALVYGSDVCQR
jgi:hypothetical protein